MLKSLKSTGKGAVILPHGVLFRGNAEGTIRSEIIKRGYIKAIIGLPANLFYGTGIPACILVIDKENAQARTGVFMIDASKGFEKDGPKNRLRPRDMHKIVDAFTNQTEVPGYSRMVPLSDIENAANDFNLNIPRYIDSSEPEDIQDLHAHIHGGIPNRDIDALEPYWTAFPSLRLALFRPLREGYSELAVDKNDVHKTITGSTEYQAFSQTTEQIVSQWWSGHREGLTSINSSTKPAELIEGVSEDLLSIFHPRPLVDEYAVYEQLMSYWNQTMHDDVALIRSAGWDAAAKPRKTIEDKDRKLSETPDLVIGSGKSVQKYKMDLLPPELIVKRYFATEKAKLEDLNAAVELATQAVEEFVEKTSSEGGVLYQELNVDKVTKTLVTAELRKAKDQDPGGEESVGLDRLLELFNAEAAAKKNARFAGAHLSEATLAKYGQLTILDIQNLLIDGKWGATVQRRVLDNTSELINSLVERITELGWRYDSTLEDLESAAQANSKSVLGALARMGITF
jgi:type I restriction enzyme M protein